MCLCGSIWDFLIKFLSKFYPFANRLTHIATSHTLPQHLWLDNRILWNLNTFGWYIQQELLCHTTNHSDRNGKVCPQTAMMRWSSNIRILACIKLINIYGCLSVAGQMPAAKRVSMLGMIGKTYQHIYTLCSGPCYSVFFMDGKNYYYSRREFPTRFYTSPTRFYISQYTYHTIFEKIYCWITIVLSSIFILV